MSVTTVTGTITATTTVTGTTGAVTNATSGANITIATAGAGIAITTTGAVRSNNLQSGEAAPPNRRGRFLGRNRFGGLTSHYALKEKTCVLLRSSAILLFGPQLIQATVF